MSQISKQALIVDNSQSFPNNNAGDITPADLRGFNVNMIDSLVDEISYQSFTASVTNSINLLNQFSASQQPSFTALNQFTASQLSINTGYNAFTYSADSRLDIVESEVDSLIAWTSSINEIIEDNVSKGYANRFNFGGLITASITPNVNGAIADISVNSDSTKTNTSSFNDLTQSVNGILNYTASLKDAITVNGTSASIAGNLDVIGTINAYKINTTIESSSVIYSSGSNIFGDADNDTQTLNGKVTISNGLTLTGNLTASGLIDGVDISVFYSNSNQFTASQEAKDITLANVTSSLNAYTASNDTKWSTLGAVTASLLQGTGSYATTGSNTFRGNQIITGSLLISSSATSDLTVVGQIFVSSSAAMAATTPKITVSGSSGTTTIFKSSITTKNLSRSANVFADFIYNADDTTADEIGFVVDATAAGLTGWSTGPAIYTQNTTDTFPAILGFQNKANYTDGRVTVLTPLVAAAQAITTGSVRGNIVSMSIAAQTASMDLSLGNFFTLTLATGSTTHLTATNIQPGQTINLLISQQSLATGSLSYNNTFKFPAASPYTASAVTGSKDILTFVTFDSSVVYSAAIKSLQ